MASLKTSYKACVYKDKAKYHYLTNVTIAKEIYIKRDQLEHVNDSTKYFAQQGHGNSYWQGIEIIANDKKELDIELKALFDSLAHYKVKVVDHVIKSTGNKHIIVYAYNNPKYIYNNPEYYV